MSLCINLNFKLFLFWFFFFFRKAQTYFKRKKQWCKYFKGCHIAESNRMWRESMGSRRCWLTPLASPPVWPVIFYMNVIFCSTTVRMSISLHESQCPFVCCFWENRIVDPRLFSLIISNLVEQRFKHVALFQSTRWSESNWSFWQCFIL